MCSTLFKSWWKNILKKFWLWNAWNIHRHHWRDQCWPMMKRSSGRRQKYVSTMIPFFVSDRWKMFQEQQKDGKVKLKISKTFVVPRRIGTRRKTDWIRAEFFKDFSSLSLLREIENDLETTSSQKTSRTGSSSCQCSMTLFGKEWWELYFECRRSQESCPEYLIRTLDVSGPGSEEKWYGDSHDQEGQWNCTSNKMVQRFKDTGHPIFKSTSALSRGILKQKKADVPFTSMEVF